MPGEVRLITSRHLPELRVLLERDPIAHCFVAARIRQTSTSLHLGGELWGWYEDGQLVSAMFAGANLIPVETTQAARTAFAERARRLGRRCSSLVGPAEEVLALWQILAPVWGPARDVRACQYLMAISQAPRVQPHPGVRRVRSDELDALLPASVAMYTEEVGVSPIADGSGQTYRARLAEAIRQGRALALFEDGRVVFKAEVGAVTPQVCQLQEVWVDPQFRGRGLGRSGVAAVVSQAQESFAPVVSLCVNDYNAQALATYRAVGFRRVGTFAAVLL